MEVELRRYLPDPGAGLSLGNGPSWTGVPPPPYGSAGPQTPPARPPHPALSTICIRVRMRTHLHSNMVSGGKGGEKTLCRGGGKNFPVVFRTKCIQL